MILLGFLAGILVGVVLTAGVSLLVSMVGNSFRRAEREWHAEQTHRSVKWGPR